MEYTGTKAAGGPPDNPPSYSAATGQPSYASVPPGPEAYVPAPPPGHVYVTAPPRAVIQTIVVQPMGPGPSRIVCKSCNHQIVTRVEMKPSVRTHLFALILCLIGCWPFACVPYCVDSCNNAEHYCPNCNSYIGSYVN